MHNNIKIILLFVLSIVLLSSSIFGNNEPTQQTIYTKEIHSEWQLIDASGSESNFTLWTADAKDKKTEIGFMLKDGMTADTSDRYLRDESNNIIKDNKNKDILLKYESAKCDGKDCYHITLSRSQSINIDTYIKIGDNSLDINYNNLSVIVYEKDEHVITCELRDEYNNSLSGTALINEGSMKFWYNLTSTGWKDMKYICYSDLEVIKYRNKHYFIDNKERIEINSKDICTQVEIIDELTDTYNEANCEFNTYSENDLNYLTIGFYGNITDPEFIITELGDGLNNGTTTAYNNTWISVSNNYMKSTNLVTYYAFDTDASMVIDYTNTSNDGTVVGATWEENCIIGGCYDFDNTDDYISIADDVSLRPLSNFCISIWAYPRTWGPSNGDQDILVRSSTSNNGNYALEFDGTPSGGHRDLQWRIDDAVAPGLTYPATGSVIDLNKWSHIVVCSKDESPGGIIYVNGVQVNTTDETSTSRTSDVSTVYIGGRVSASGTDGFDGLIDEFKFYGRGLSSDEIF